MKHLLKDNIGILFPRQAITEKFGYFVTNKISDINFTGTAGQFGAGLLFPLYVYPESKGHTQEDPIPNFKKQAVDEIEDKIGIKYKIKTEKGERNAFNPLDLLNYIYAILYSSTYRKTYKEYLKIDFPRIPYPKDKKVFWKLVDLGDKLRSLHLMESDLPEDDAGNYPVVGSNVITRKIIKKDWDFYDQGNSIGRIWINDDQYFDNVPLNTWELYIGGYMPAQKWLKDRTGRKLDYEDISHYQSILITLTRTIRLVNEIDKVYAA
jgi:predicted helicase